MNLKIIAIEEIEVKAASFQAQLALMQLIEKVAQVNLSSEDFDYVIDRMLKIQKFFEIDSLYKFQEDKRKKQ